MATIYATATINPSGTITCRTGCDFDLITGQNIELATQVGPNLYAMDQGPFHSEFQIATPLPGAAVLYGSALILVVALMKITPSKGPYWSKDHD